MRADDPLRELLHRKVREASDEAAKHDGDVPAGELDALNRLARLVEVRDKTIPATAPRWRIAAVLASTLVLVSLLLFLRVRATQVELQLVVSEAGFTLAQRQVVTGIVNLAELGVSGIRDVRVSDAELAQWIAESAREEHGAVRVAAMRGDGDGSSGTVTLNPLSLPAGVGIRIQEGSTPARCRLSLAGAQTTLRTTLHGPVRIALQGAGAREPVLEIPSALLADTEQNEVALDLHFAEESAAAFAPQLSIDKLDVSRIDEFQAPDGTTAQAVSTILAGTLYLESLGGETRTLRPRELLRFDEARGVIRTLQLENGHLTLAFRGTVRGMRSGWGKNPSSLMPTWLEWLRARHGLSLLWAATLYLFGVITAILRWWRISL